MAFHSAKFDSGERGNELATSAALRAFVVLECIASTEHSPTLDEITRASGLPKPTVYRILQLLVRSSLVEREVHDRRYSVGSRTAALALAVQGHAPRRTERSAILARLVDTIGETCNFTMLDGNEVVYLERVETAANVRLHMRAGSRVPLHCTASGKLLLSSLAPAQVRRLLGSGPLRRYTERTIVDVDLLMREIAKIRTTGVGTDTSEYLEGSVCLAVPVLDPRGRMCATLAVHGPAPRMSLKKGYGFLPAMRQAAELMGATLVADGATRAIAPRSTHSRTPRIAA